MSLQPGLNVVDSATNKATNTARSSLTDNALPTAQRHAGRLGTTTTRLTDVTTPGEFPGERTQDNAPAPDASSGPWYAPIKAWFRDTIPITLDWFESTVKWVLAWIFPPPRQAALFEEALQRPYATSLLVCQLICCGVPFLVFLAGTFIFAAVSVLLWAILSFIIIGPIFLVACIMGVYMWSWGLVLYAVIKWVDRTFLGGVISKFWLSQMTQQQPPQDSQDDGGGKEAKEETEEIK
ncbi:hypothetical protein BDV26DRAFT_197791 [Aspergillus bertholletiae]|uniref:Uncharacterized protein n=1 Tax=Aspergillus bertholletiae TaxID=1226010 RepID=A0A5N7B8U8_9EURO|nr:hypothetical protein BDV26DRAFT_197791 [Aspergillus bertholletiae]